MEPGPPVALVGCPEKDTLSVKHLLRSSPLNLRPDGVVENGDRVLFCISACHGPSVETRLSVRSLAGKSIVPVAVVLACADLVTDDSLRELINCEERALLATVLPEDLVDELPLLLDLDPNLAHWISELICRTDSDVRCRVDSL